jgi:hypothetical protein
VDIRGIYLDESTLLDEWYKFEHEKCHIIDVDQITLNDTYMSELSHAQMVRQKIL